MAQLPVDPVDPVGCIAVFAASARRDSVNKHVARVVSDVLGDRRVEAQFVDLADYEMPLYHGDIESVHGIPEPTHRLAEQLRPAIGLLIASPEHNGAMTALLKNTIDWLTRIDLRILAGKYVGLMAASPGRLGGTRGLGLVRQWMDTMELAVAPEKLSIPRVGEVLDASGEVLRFDDDTMRRIDVFLDAYLDGLAGHTAAERAS